MDGGIDPLSPSAPRYPSKVPGIKLELYEHQRLALHPLSILEAKGVVKCDMPPIRAESEAIGGLFKEVGRRTGIFESDAWFIHLPVGSGKTLIVLALIATERVPKKRKIIVGVDFSHAFLCSCHSEVVEFPRHDPSQLSLIGDNPWYFANDAPAYPSITPKIIDRAEISDDDILPSSVFMVGPNLIEQMRGYCETQVEYPWYVITDMKSLSAFLIDSCVDPRKTFGRYHLIIMPARTYSRADTVTIEVQAKAKVNELVAKQGDLSAIGRINKMVNLLLTRQKNLPTTDFLTAFCGSHAHTKVLARLIIDDYDTLHLQCATRPPALVYIFISGTSMSQPGNQFGFPSKPSYQTYARRAMSIAVEPSQVLAYIGLPAPEEQAVLCLEGVAQKLFMHLCQILTHYILCYRHLAMQHFGKETMDPFRDLPDHFRCTAEPMTTMLAAIQQALNCDSIASVLELLFLMHKCGSMVGFPILPDEMAVKRDPKKATFGSLGSILFRKIYSERMRVNVNLLALECLERIVNEKGMPSETRYIVAAARNFTTSFSFPECSIPFKEVTTVAMEPQFALAHLARAQIPIGKQPDDNVIRYIWEFVQPRPDVMQLPKYLEFVAPYVVYAIWAGKNFGNTFITPDVFAKTITEARENLSGIATTVNNITHSSAAQESMASKCVACNKISTSSILLTCCSTICCYHCIPKVMATTVNGVVCTVCKTRPEDSRSFCLPMQTEEVKTISEVATVFQSIQATREQAKQIPSAEKKLEMLARINLFYFPICGAMMKAILPPIASVPEFPSAYTSVTLDKTQSLKVAVEKLISARDGAVKILLYHNYMDVNEAISESLAELHVKICTFNPNEGNMYRNTDSHLIVIANDLSQICGFNMEYLDAVVFYSPPKHADEKKQIVCRGQRLGRNSKHKLIVLTMFYPREMSNEAYQVPTINDLPLWKNLAKIMLTTKPGKSAVPTPTAVPSFPPAPSTAIAIPAVPSVPSTAVPSVPSTAVPSVPSTAVPSTAVPLAVAAVIEPQVPSTVAVTEPQVPSTVAVVEAQVPSTVAVVEAQVPSTAAVAEPQVPSTVAVTEPQVPQEVASAKPIETVEKKEAEPAKPIETVEKKEAEPAKPVETAEKKVTEQEEAAVVTNGQPVHPRPAARIRRARPVAAASPIVPVSKQ
jgi:hypothetical protein